MATSVEDGTIKWCLVPAATIFLICSVVGLVGNMIMLICFSREKKFHTSCHCMIALNCLADMIHLNGQFVFVYQLFFRTSSTQETCFWMLLPTQIGVFMSGPLIIALGIDRLIACTWPFWYQILTKHSKMYLVVQLIFPIFHTSWLIYNSYEGRDPTTRVKCSVPYSMGIEVVRMFTESGIFINSSIILIYFITYLKIRSFFGNHMKAVFKSIGCTVLFVLFGWTAITIVNLFGMSLISDKSLIPVVSTYAGIGVNVACSCNVFVFYAINPEYREAIRKTLGMKATVSTRVTEGVYGTCEMRGTRSTGTISTGGYPFI